MKNKLLISVAFVALAGAVGLGVSHSSSNCRDGGVYGNTFSCIALADKASGGHTVYVYPSTTLYCAVSPLASSQVKTFDSDSPLNPNAEGIFVITPGNEAVFTGFGNASISCAKTAAQAQSSLKSY